MGSPCAVPVGLQVMSRMSPDVPGLIQVFMGSPCAVPDDVPSASSSDVLVLSQVMFSRSPDVLGVVVVFR